MFIDCAGFRPPAAFEHDICIIGAGAAGISIARELIGSGRDVCLLESGGFELEDRSQDLYAGILDGTDIRGDYLSGTRLRVFGGSTMAWGGLCRPMDEIDFEAKPWVDDYPGWPFGRSELIPYYDRAAEVVEIKPFFASGPERLPFLRPEIGLVSLPFRTSPPVFMGATYRTALEEARNVTVYLHANALEVVPTPAGDHIGRLRVLTVDGAELAVRARVYVLCAGGIETVRILLNSDSVVPGGIGNRHDLLGRFFMSHFPLVQFGRALFVVKDVQALMRSLVSKAVHYVSVKEETRRERHLLSAGFLFHPTVPVFEGRIPRGMEQVLPQFESLLRGELRAKTVPLLAVPEHAPNRESRITLSAERDATGTRRVRLQFRRSPIDIESLRANVEILARELGGHAVGRLQTVFTEGEAPALRPDDHHLGATRMHRDPRQGVVDATGRVHGVDNLYVAGPSVFPSGGFANPVLTIIALALRLADHLKEGPR